MLVEELKPTIIKKRPVLLAFFCLFFLVACSKQSNIDSNKVLWVFNGATMGTTYSVKVSVDSDVPQKEKQLAEEIQTALIEFNQSMSTYIEDSELSLINKASKDEWLPLSDSLATVLDMSAAIFIQSNGAFDVTVGPLVNLWGFGPESITHVPSDPDIEKVKRRIGMRLIQRKGQSLKKLGDVYIDLSAVAKGYATDVIAELLESHNIYDYMVEIGGELKIRGNSTKGKTWTIGIEKPSLGHTGALQKLTGDNIAIATSGDYRNYYERGGVRISHTIDPVTGKPINHKLVSVTVVTESGGYADAYATALNVLGPEKGLDLAEQQKLAAFFIIRDGESFRFEQTKLFQKYTVED